MVNNQTIKKLVVKKTTQAPSGEKLIGPNPSRLARRRENLLASAEAKNAKAKEIRENPALSIKPGFQVRALHRRAQQERQLASDIEKKRVGMLGGKSKPNVSENPFGKQKGTKDL